MDTKLAWYVIEDNGGGLTLIVQGENEDVDIYVHTGYEQVPGQLSQDLAALGAGEDPLTWEGNEAQPGEDLAGFSSHDNGWEIIVDGPPIRLYPDRMGAAGHKEFGQ